MLTKVKKFLADKLHEQLMPYIPIYIPDTHNIVRQETTPIVTVGAKYTTMITAVASPDAEEYIVKACLAQILEGIYIKKMYVSSVQTSIPDQKVQYCVRLSVVPPEHDNEEDLS